MKRNKPEDLCEVCGKVVPNHMRWFMNKRIPTPHVCSEGCLKVFLKNTRKTEWRNFVKKILPESYPNGLESLAIKHLTRVFGEVLYNRFLFEIRHGSRNFLYVPDVYIPEYDCFLEVKGVSYGINKAKRASKVIPLYFLTKDYMEFWGWK